VAPIQPGIYRCLDCLYIIEKNLEKILEYDYNPVMSLRKNTSYHKSSYFDQHIKALEMLKIPNITEKNYERIENYIKHYDIVSLNTSKLRNILKYLKLPKLYNHIPYLLCKLDNNNIPKDLCDKDKDQLMSMFKGVEYAWSNLYRGRKKSFFGYKYCLRKIIELMGTCETRYGEIYVNTIIGNSSRHTKWPSKCTGVSKTNDKPMI